MTNAARKALAFSHFNFGINRIFEDYCQGIRANVEEYHYLDYIEEYRRLGKRRFEQMVETLIADKNITHVFLIWWSCDLTFDTDFIARLASKVRVVMNFFDTEYFFEGVDRYYAQFADLVLLPDELSRYRYEHLCIPAYTSFSLFNGQAYLAKEKIKQDIDVSFIGNLKQADRAEYVHFLREHGIRVQTYGVGSDNGFISFDEMIRIFNRSRINLNFTGTASFDNYAIDLPRINQRIKQSKGRPIEIALCGGFILSQHAAGIERMFSLEEEFDTFRSKEELLAKVVYYLEHANLRSEMAHRGYLRALTNYDAVAGFRLALDKLDLIPRPHLSRPYLDRSFRRHYAAFRFFYVALFMLQGRLARVVEEFAVIVAGRCLDPVAAYHFAIRGVLHYLREHPKLEQVFKSVRRWLPLKLKY